jgi:hypothetical protein
MLAPDKEKHDDLIRRQRIAEKARPKPKASEMRFCEVLNSAAANTSAADREAARQHWIAEMQAKADPKQIRRAARDAETAKREKEQAEEQAARQQFEQKWYEREAVRRAEQQERTAEVNAKAKQHWSQVVLQETTPSVQEPVIPVPENVDFGAVRRKFAAERAGRGADIVANVSSRSASRHISGHNRCQVEDASTIIRAQNAELEISLMHDRIKDLENQRHAVMARISTLQEELEAVQQQREYAEQRLTRYGENPKLLAEIDTCAMNERKLQESYVQAREELEGLSEQLEETQRLLIASGSSRG